MTSIDISFVFIGADRTAKVMVYIARNGDVENEKTAAASATDPFTWDNKQLWEAAGKHTPFDLDLSSLPEAKDDAEYQKSDEAKNDTEYQQRINNADLSYPIILTHDGDVVDGMHRIAKATRGGQNSIKAVQLNTPT